jgi:hypothetical protein
MRVINLDPWPLDESPRPKIGKFAAKLTGHHFGGKINWFKPNENELKKRAHDLKNHECVNCLG